jgi:hypothetical protein
MKTNKIIATVIMALVLTNCTYIRTETGLLRNGFLKEVGGTWVIDTIIITKRTANTKPDTVLNGNLIGEINIVNCDPKKGESCAFDNKKADGRSIAFTYNVGTVDKNTKEMIVTAPSGGIAGVDDISAAYNAQNIEKNTFTLITQNSTGFANIYGSGNLTLKLKRK